MRKGWWALALGFQGPPSYVSAAAPATTECQQHSGCVAWALS